MMKSFRAEVWRVSLVRARSRYGIKEGKGRRMAFVASRCGREGSNVGGGRGKTSVGKRGGEGGRARAWASQKR